MERQTQLKDLLSMSVWTYREIMKYNTKIRSKTTAIKIKNMAVKEFDGAVPYGSKYVKTDSVLNCFGTTREKEIERLRQLNEA